MDNNNEGKKSRSTIQNLWRCALLMVGVVAVVQELRKPDDQRTWQGKVAGFVPYDFRKPTVERAKETYWNPTGSIMSPRMWGVGWSPNFAAMKRKVSTLASSSE